MRTSIIALSSALAATSPALAQDASTTAGWTPDIVVTGLRDGYDAPAAASATRVATPVEKIPQSIQALTRQLIEDQDLQNLTDALPATLVFVDRIEVAMGPTATLYGGGAGAPLSGLVNLVSRDPSTAKLSASVGLRAGSFNTWGGDADINLPLGEAAAFRVSGYAPDPSIKGGTLATTSAPVGEMMSEMFAPVASMFRAMAKS